MCVSYDPEIGSHGLLLSPSHGRGEERLRATVEWSIRSIQWKLRNVYDLVKIGKVQEDIYDIGEGMIRVVPLKR